MKDIIQTRFAEHTQAIEATLEALADRIEQAAELMIDTYRNGRGVFIFGNGGSASDAQHIAGELVGRFLLDRPGLKAQALSTDTSVMTSLANDYSFDMIFARQLEACGEAGDLAIGLSTSGNSPNVVAAMKYAKANGMRTISFTKAGGGQCAALSDVLIDIPADSTARVQEVGTLIYHILCELVEAAMAQPRD